jgi:hypothetical protein
MKLLKRLREKLAQRAVEGGFAALLIGLLSELAGIDIAPTEIDTLMTAAAVLAAIYGRWRERRVVP